MNEPKCEVPLAVVMAVHEAQLAQHGGGAGFSIRDYSSRLWRGRNGFTLYSRELFRDADEASLLRVCASACAKNHAFVAGNKRTAWIVSADASSSV